MSLFISNLLVTSDAARSAFRQCPTIEHCAGRGDDAD